MDDGLKLMTINLKTSIIVAFLLWAGLARGEETMCGDLDGVACGAGFFGYEMNEEIRGAPDGVDELWGTYYTNMRNPPKPFDRVRALYDVHGVCAVRGSFVVEGASESGVRQKEQVDILAKQLEPRYGKPDERYFNVPYNPNLAPSNDEGEIEEVRSFGGYSWQADGSPLSIDPHGAAGLAPPRYPDEVSVITLAANGDVVELEYRFANMDDCVERNRPWARYDDDEGICSIWGLVARDFVAELEQQYLETLIYRWSGSDGDQNPYRDGRYYCRDHPDHVGGIRVYADESTVELRAVFGDAGSCEQAAANRLMDYWVYSYLRGEEVCEAAFGHAWSGVGVCLMPVPVFLQARPEGDYVDEFDIGSPREGACIGDAETRRRRDQDEEEWRFAQRSGNPETVSGFPRTPSKRALRRSSTCAFGTAERLAVHRCGGAGKRTGTSGGRLDTLPRRHDAAGWGIPGGSARGRLRDVDGDGAARRLAYKAARCAAQGRPESGRLVPRLSGMSADGSGAGGFVPDGFAIA